MSLIDSPDSVERVWFISCTDLLDMFSGTARSDLPAPHATKSMTAGPWHGLRLFRTAHEVGSQTPKDKIAASRAKSGSWRRSPNHRATVRARGPTSVEGRASFWAAWAGPRWFVFENHDGWITAAPGVAAHAASGWAGQSATGGATYWPGCRSRQSTAGQPSDQRF